MTAKQVAKWAQKAREAIFQRDVAILAWHREGASLREIGDAAGLPHTTVANIIKRGSK